MFLFLSAIILDIFARNPGARKGFETLNSKSLNHLTSFSCLVAGSKFGQIISFLLLALPKEAHFVSLKD